MYVFMVSGLCILMFIVHYVYTTVWRVSRSSSWRTPGLLASAWSIPSSLAGDWSTPGSLAGDWRTPGSLAGDWSAPGSLAGDWRTPSSLAGDWRTPCSLAGDWRTSSSLASDWRTHGSFIGWWLERSHWRTSSSLASLISSDFLTMYCAGSPQWQEAYGDRHTGEGRHWLPVAARGSHSNDSKWVNTCVLLCSESGLSLLATVWYHDTVLSSLQRKAQEHHRETEEAPRNRPWN